MLVTQVSVEMELFVQILMNVKWGHTIVMQMLIAPTSMARSLVSVIVDTRVMVCYAQTSMNAR